MTIYVFDASAFLAIVRDEVGADIAVTRVYRATMSVVNASEALMRGVEKGAPLELMREFLSAQQVELVPFDFELAIAASLLRPATKHLGLSFADRACIATAIRFGATIVTADRAWSSLDLPCNVELIR